MYAAKPIRKATANHFPFTDTRVAYFTTFEDELIPVIINKQSVMKLEVSDAPLFAVWPGQYTSDIFEVDLLDVLKAFL